MSKIRLTIKDNTFLFSVLMVIVAASGVYIGDFFVNENRWLVEVFENREFKGVPDVWSAKQPYIGPDPRIGAKEARASQYSFRYHTCLHTGTPEKLIFVLTSDEDSRLKGNGSVLIENRETQELQSSSYEMEVDGSPMHLEVEFVDAKVGAYLTFYVGRLNGRLGKIPESLHYLPNNKNENWCSLR